MSNGTVLVVVLLCELISIICGVTAIVMTL